MKYLDKKGALPEFVPMIVIYIILFIIAVTLIYLVYTGGLDFIKPAIEMGGKKFE